MKLLDTSSSRRVDVPQDVGESGKFQSGFL